MGRRSRNLGRGPGYSVVSFALQRSSLRRTSAFVACHRLDSGAPASHALFRFRLRRCVICHCRACRFDLASSVPADFTVFDCRLIFLRLSICGRGQTVRTNAVVGLSGRSFLPPRGWSHYPVRGRQRIADSRQYVRRSNERGTLGFLCTASETKLDTSVEVRPESSVRSYSGNRCGRHLRRNHPVSKIGFFLNGRSGTPKFL